MAELRQVVLDVGPYGQTPVSILESGVSAGTQPAVFLLLDLSARPDVNGHEGVGSPANPVKVRRAEPARNEGRELSLDRVCEPGGVAASLARIRLF
jgi:hypothetical protein